MHCKDLPLIRARRFDGVNNWTAYLLDKKSVISCTVQDKMLWTSMRRNRKGITMLNKINEDNGGKTCKGSKLTQ